MHVLVIGGTSYMGPQLVWRLLARGDGVTVLNRGRHADPFGRRVERLVADPRGGDFERVLAGRSFDAAVDFAAYTASDARGVVEALGGRIGRYVFISSGQVYLVRDRPPLPAGEDAYDGPLLTEPEDERDRNQWRYGMDKREAEDVLEEAWEGKGFPSVRLRIPVVNGPQDPSRRLEGYLWRLLDGGPLVLPDGGRRLLRHIYSVDVARAIIDLLSGDMPPHLAYNLAGGETVTVAELVEMLASIIGSPARMVDVSTSRIEAAGLLPTDVSPFSGRWGSLLDSTRAEHELLFRPTPLPTVLETIVASFLAGHPADPPDGYRGRAAELALIAA